MDIDAERQSAFDFWKKIHKLVDGIHLFAIARPYPDASRDRAKALALFYAASEEYVVHGVNKARYSPNVEGAAEVQRPLNHLADLLQKEVSNRTSIGLRSMFRSVTRPDLEAARSNLSEVFRAGQDFRAAAENHFTNAASRLADRNGALEREIWDEATAEQHAMLNEVFATPASSNDIHEDRGSWHNSGAPRFSPNNHVRAWLGQIDDSSGTPAEPQPSATSSLKSFDDKENIPPNSASVSPSPRSILPSRQSSAESGRSGSIIPETDYGPGGSSLDDRGSIHTQSRESGSLASQGVKRRRSILDVDGNGKGEDRPEIKRLRSSSLEL